MEYIGVGIFTLAIELLAFTKQGFKMKIVLYYTVGVFLVLFSGLRYGGVDYFNYKGIFNNVVELSSSTIDNFFNVHGELAYYLINALIKSFDMPFEMVIFVVSITSISLLIKNSVKYSPYPFLVILLYYNRFFFG